MLVNTFINHLKLEFRRSIAVVYSEETTCFCDAPYLFLPQLLIQKSAIIISTRFTREKFTNNFKRFSKVDPNIFVFIDAFSKYYDSSCPEGFIVHSETVMNEIYSLVATNLVEGCCIIFDDLVPFLIAGVDLNSIIATIRKIVHLAEEKNCLLVTFIQDDLEYHPSDVLVESLKSLADTILVCRGLSTGKSIDVDGSIAIKKGKRCFFSDAPLELCLEYKVNSRDISFFGRGLSRGSI